MASKPKVTTKVLCVVSDLHGGSTVGLCPPEGVRLDDAGEYHPSKTQLWLWQCWERTWAEADRICREFKADLWTEYNGDLTDGDHHNTSQIISGNPDAQNYVVRRAFDVPRALRPARTFVVRGTEAHVGGSGSAEEAIAEHIGAERDPELQTWSRWHLRLDVNGTLFDFQHHGRTGTRPWTRQNALSAAACEIWMEHALRGQRHPDVAVRSHRHVYGDSYDAYPTRVIQTPAYQLKTAFGHKIAANSIADIGGVIFVVEPDGKYQVLPQLFTPTLPKVV